MKQFITTTQLAHLANRSVDGLRYLMRTGRLKPDAKTEAGAALFDRSTAERWARDHRLEKATPPEAAQ